MRSSDEKILVDIDTTLDQLIKNATTFERIASDALYAEELTALQKTQESLLARLVHMNDLLGCDEKRKACRKQPSTYHSIEHKIARFGRLSAKLASRLQKEMKTAHRPIIRKNRKKQPVR